MDKAATKIVDEGSFVKVSDGIRSTDPLDWPDYRSTLEAVAAKSGVDEAMVAGAARIGGHEVELALFDFSFMGGSMGEVAGERVARALERAADRKVPFVLRTATGGARMQEGMRSLVQMPKLVAARSALADASRPLLCVLGHPTAGGVLASIAGLADLTVAEAGATIGFAGPRIARRVTGEPLPETSHSAASAFSHGLVDEVVTSEDVRAYLVTALETLAPDEPVDEEAAPLPGSVTRDIDAWDAVQAARAAERPHAPDLARAIADQSFVELRGDRSGEDDAALTCGLLRIAGRRALILALERDHAPRHPAYQKAVRCLRVAGRLRIPVVSLIDTRGADPSADSEAGGIAFGIAQLFEAMLEVPTPTLAIVTGEGGSGGALAFATADRLVAYEDSIFSVIGPESAAEILWRDPSRAADAARYLKPTAASLRDLGIADGIVRGPLEPGGLRSAIARELRGIEHAGSPEERRKRWRTR